MLCSIQSYGELMECFFGTFGNYLVSAVQVIQIFFIVGECSVSQIASVAVQILSQAQTFWPMPRP